jgi:sugar lactone lactonase YvrE
MAEAEPLEVRCVDPAAALLGEGPVWVARDQALYWVDIRGRQLHCYNYASEGDCAFGESSSIACS